LPDSIDKLEKCIESISKLLPPTTRAASVIIPPVIQLSSGETFNFVKPSHSNFNIVDIAHALSNICRFNGHCKEFYSVAQHCVLVSQNVPREHALAALLHDASEAFLGDVTKPLKKMLTRYQDIEVNVERVIYERFCVDMPIHQSVKQADISAMATEVRDLMDADSPYWGYHKAFNGFLTPLFRGHQTWPNANSLIGSTFCNLKLAI
jgi:hypothetical protein